MSAVGSAVKGKNLFRRDMPLYVTIILSFVSGLLVYFLFPQPSEGKKNIPVAQTNDCLPEMEVLRSHDYKLTHRVLLIEPRNENPHLDGIKNKLNNYISQIKSSNGVENLSVYYRNLSTNSWFEINGADVYNPASLMKVTFLIAILKEAESNPKILDKQIFFEKHFAESNTQNIVDFQLKENRNYPMKELLADMIIHSDNDAATLVSLNTNMGIYKKMFTDLDIPEPPMNNSEYFISVIDFCKFFRVLYSSSYLKDEYSEFALDLLSKSTYKDGLLKELNNNFPVSHKFGERIINKVQQLHEIGIFYSEGHPYLLGVMSSGHDLKQLSNVLSNVSKIVYSENNQAE